MALNAAQISAVLPADSLWRGKLTVEARVDSTNTQLKQAAARGAAEGTVLCAVEQTDGRGTRGRCFHSPGGKGLYLSVLLRPRVPTDRLLTLTGRAAAAVRQGIEDACGAPADIKWLNDILLYGRKVCGILTELCPDGAVVLGIGVNLTQTEEDFRRAGLDGIAVSLSSAGYPAEVNRLCAALLTRLEEMYRGFLTGDDTSLSHYRAHCVTPGRAVEFEFEGRLLRGVALDVDDAFALRVRGEDGTVRTVTAGTVTPL